MTLTQAVIIAVGSAALVEVACLLRPRREAAVDAAFTSSGYQEATIVVRGGYIPSTVRVRQGAPVRLTFSRQESTPCSRTLVFDAFGLHVDLPQEQLVLVQLMPGLPGEYRFTCGKRVLHGKLVVH